MKKKPRNRKSSISKAKAAFPTQNGISQGQTREYGHITQKECGFGFKRWFEKSDLKS